jgi:hypothetical protein
MSVVESTTMKQRVFFLPATVIGPRGCENLPALRTALDTLRAEFDVQVHTHPWFRGGTTVPPHREDHLADLRGQISDGSHFVAMGTMAEMALMAIDRTAKGPRVKSLVAVGIYPFAGTLRGLHLESMAVLQKAQSRSLTGHSTVRVMMQGATDEELDAAVEDLDAQVDWDYWTRCEPSYSDFNLLADAPVIDVPTLFLHSPLDPDRVMSEAFLRVVPEAETGALDVWPTRMQDAASGDEMANKVAEFIRNHS